MLQQNDKELLQQFRQPVTKEESFKSIIEKYQDRLYWHIRRMVIDHESANDILQNTFINVWNHLGNFREDSQLYTWMYRIATNECLTFLAHQKKKKLFGSISSENDLTNKVIAENNFNGNQLEWKLQLAISKLPEKQRLIFNLRYFDEMPYKAISKILKTSESGLKTNYHLAVKKIEEFIRNQTANY